MDISVKLSAAYPASTAPAANTPLPVVAVKKEDTVTPVTEPKREDLEKAVSDIREFVQASQRQLDFSIDDSTGVVVVKVIATHSGEVIRQLPSETALKLAQSLSDAGSVLFDTNA